MTMNDLPRFEVSWLGEGGMNYVWLRTPEAADGFAERLRMGGFSRPVAVRELIERAAA